MKKLTRITETLKIGKYTTTYNYFPRDEKELKKLLCELLKERGAEADLNDIDVSRVTDMTNLFLCSSFRGDISGWDVSNVVAMPGMFLRHAIGNYEYDPIQVCSTPQRVTPTR